MLAKEAAGDGDEMLQEIYADFLEREGVVVDIATLCRTIRDRPWLQPAGTGQASPAHKKSIF